MLTHRLVPALLVAGLAAASAHAQFTNAPDSAPAVVSDSEYAWLLPATLPPPAPMIDAAMAALPKSVRQKEDWLARMRKAAWIPNLDLRYNIGQVNVRRYQVLQNRQQISTSSQTTRESSSQSGQSVGSSSGDNNTSIYGSGAQPLGVQTEQHNGTSSGQSLDQSAGSGTKVATQTGTTTTDEGPGSYALGDDLRWVNQYGVYFTWDLSRILFRQEEISVLHAEIEKETFRENVRAQVIQTYYDLKEALLLLQSGTYKDSIPTKIRKERLAYLLDTLTGGSLSSHDGHKAP